MPFRIRPDRDFTREFHKAAGGQLRHAIRTLQERPEGTHEAIHAFRKNLKRVRSLFRLVARAVPEFQARENARLRDVAGSVSAMRDATGIAETVAYLRANARDADETAALGRIIETLHARRDRLADAESGLDAKLSDAIDEMEKAMTALDAVRFHSGHSKGARLLARGWRNTARKARQAIDQCHEGVSAEAFHTLRKQTQDYRAFHAVLSAIWPAAMQAKYDAASGLIDLLGHVHDLDILCDLVEAEPCLFNNADDLAHLLDAIIVRQQLDRHAALEKAEEVFADDPDREADRIETLWIIAKSG